MSVRSVLHCSLGVGYKKSPKFKDNLVAKMVGKSKNWNDELHPLSWLNFVLFQFGAVNVKKNPGDHDLESW